MKIQSIHYCISHFLYLKIKVCWMKRQIKTLQFFVIFFQGSKFYENELKKDQQVNQRIEKMMQLKEKITQQQLVKAQLQVLTLYVF